MPSTRFSLREPTTQMQARAREVEQWAQLRADEQRRFTDGWRRAAGQSADRWRSSLPPARFMSAQEASTYGLIDEICRPRGEIHQMPGPPIGFRPGR